MIVERIFGFYDTGDVLAMQTCADLICIELGIPLRGGAPGVHADRADIAEAVFLTRADGHADIEQLVQATRSKLSVDWPHSPTG